MRGAILIPALVVPFSASQPRARARHPSDNSDGCLALVAWLYVALSHLERDGEAHPDGNGLVPVQRGRKPVHTSDD